MTNFLMPYTEPKNRKKNPGGNALWALAAVVGALAVAGSVFWIWRNYQSATTPPVKPRKDEGETDAMDGGVDEEPFMAPDDEIPAEGGGIEGNKGRARADYTERFRDIDRAMRKYLDEAAVAKGVQAGWAGRSPTGFSQGTSEPDAGPDVWDQREAWWAATRAFDEAFPELDPYTDISIEEWSKDINPQFVVDDAWLMGMVMKKAMTMTEAEPAIAGTVRPDWTIFV